ncbi:MAG: efflux RND transporter permease subunit [Candidatus Marinimicrobia bacterium]|nr:efflux RND transporter permease subunit [Candidatus Neomarinimicrobiota bacterium]
MKISKVAINRGITFTMIYIIAIGFGLFGLGQLKLDLYPDITFPIIGIMTDYKGVGPEDIENSITRPLEKTVITVENLEKITSWSKSGSSTLLLEFDWGTDMDQAEIDVRKMIDFVRDYLPDEASQPMSFAFNPSMQPIMFITVSSDKLGMAELRKLITDRIEPSLERIVGVASAGTTGGLERQIRILIDPRKLAAHGVALQTIIQTLGMENLQIPGGLIDDEYTEYAVRTYGEYTNVDQIRNTVIGVRDAAPIYLKNVAQVIDGYKEQSEIVRNNNQPAIFMFIQKQSDANTVQTASAVLEELPKISEEIGQGIEFNIIWDQSKFIKRSLSNLTNTAIQAFFLAFLVLLFFLRHIRSSLIASISIPVSIIITFFVMSQIGVTLNIISMAGLALAVGMLIDNSIVVLENIFRHREMNKEIRIASDDGTTEVGVAIIASTLTTLAIFVPIFFVPGIAGVMFKDMVVSIVCSLSVSLLVALTLIPLMSSRLLGKEKKRSDNKLLRYLDEGIGNFIEATEKWYVRLLDWALGHKKYVFVVIIALIVATIIVFPKVGGEFMPKTDQSFIQARVERETRASLTTTDKTFRKMEKIIDEEVPEADNVQISFGMGEGFAAMFGSGSNRGEINISLPDVNERKRDSFEIESILRKRFEKLPGTKITMESGGMMFGSGGDIEIKIFGYDRKITTTLGDELEERMKKVDGVVDIIKSYSQPKPEYQIRIDRDRISVLGLSVYQVATTIEAAVKGKLATKFREGGEEYDVVVQLDESYRQSKTDLENIFITSLTGAQIPLKNVATVISGEAASQIDREDQERMVSVSCSVTGRDLQSVLKDIENEIQRMNFPPNYRWEIGGQAEDMQESFMWLGIAIIVAMFLVYMVMASQFESLLDPFIIIFTVPLAIIGAVWGLFLTGTTMSVTALIGMILLVGIVVNNGIVLVDYINQLREKHGHDLWVAILIGGKRRMRPILMTALTTILAMIPIALKLGSGAELWVGMARAVIGGLTLATLLTLILIPIIYLFFEQITLKRAMKKHKCEMKPIGKPEDFDLSKIV